jgi:hypothetical protein
MFNRIPVPYQVNVDHTVAVTEFKEHPSMFSIKEVGGLEPLTPAQLEGIAIAAYICRMYGTGGRFAEAIESHGEQQRARYWMKREKMEHEQEGMEKASPPT